MDYFAQIITSPEGGTASLNERITALPDTGYYVGGLVSPLVIDDVDSITQDDRWNLEVFVAYLIETVGADYIGWWTDSETGKLWIDGTTWHLGEFIAARVGRERGELAIYDIRGERELRLAYVEGE